VRTRRRRARQADRPVAGRSRRSRSSRRSPGHPVPRGDPCPEAFLDEVPVRVDEVGDTLSLVLEQLVGGLLGRILKRFFGLGLRLFHVIFPASGRDSQLAPRSPNPPACLRAGNVHNTAPSTDSRSARTPRTRLVPTPRSLWSADDLSERRRREHHKSAQPPPPPRCPFAHTGAGLPRSHRPLSRPVLCFRPPHRRVRAAGDRVGRDGPGRRASPGWRPPRRDLAVSGRAVPDDPGVLERFHFSRLVCHGHFGRADPSARPKWPWHTSILATSWVRRPYATRPKPLVPVCGSTPSRSVIGALAALPDVPRLARTR